jgi:hypothetical protein
MKKDYEKLLDFASNYTDYDLFLYDLKKNQEYPFNYFSEYPEARLKSLFYINHRFPDLRLDFDKHTILHPHLTKLSQLAEEFICFDMYKEHHKVEEYKRGGYIYLSTLHYNDYFQSGMHYMIKPKFDFVEDTFWHGYKKYHLFVGFRTSEKTFSVWGEPSNFIGNFTIGIVDFDIKPKKL